VSPVISPVDIPQATLTNGLSRTSAASALDPGEPLALWIPARVSSVIDREQLESGANKRMQPLCQRRDHELQPVPIFRARSATS